MISNYESRINMNQNSELPKTNEQRHQPPKTVAALKRKPSAVTLSLFGCCLSLIILISVLLASLVFLGKNLSKFTHFELLHKNNSYKSNSVQQIRQPKLIFQPQSVLKYLPSEQNLFTNLNNETNINQTMSKILEKLSFRLPKEIIPKYYDLLLYPDLKKKTFSGEVKINLNILKPISYISLHSKNLNVTTNNFEKIVNNSLPLLINDFSTFKYETYELWVTEFKNDLEIGEYNITLSFNGSLTDRIVGLYQSSYFDKETNMTRWIATSKFEPTYARQAFPCFDEPAMKAKFKITLVHPNDDGYTALSNMNVEKTIKDENNTKVIFNESVAMSTYLTCFIVSDFKSETKLVNTHGIGETFNISVYSTPAQVDKVLYALDIGALITEYYIQYFNISYPLPKLDMVAIPDFVSGAMEHWGLVTFRETALLYDEKVSSSANQQRVGSVIAHELAHMWFGNLVTMKWWNDLWLNEGFASYIQYKGLDYAEMTWGMMDQFLVESLHGVLKLDATLATHPIIQTVENPDEITEIFDSITYQKGASIIRMLEDFVEPENFRKAVTKYLNDFKYGNAVTDDLLNRIAELNLDFDVKFIMQTWTQQEGFPVVSVQKISGTEYKLTQKRFLSNPEDEDKQLRDSAFNYKWYIPITYLTSESNSIKRLWFKHSDGEAMLNLPQTIKWFKLNSKQVGFYRVNYPKENWEALTVALKADINVLSISDRAHLLNDAFSLADAAQLNYSIAMDLASYLINETEYVPWSVAATNLKFIRNILYHTQIYEDFIQYGKNIINDVYNSVGWNVGTNHLKNRLRVEILSLACAMGIEDCLEIVGKKFDQWLINPEKRPNPDIRSVVYYYGMFRVGNEEKWNKVWNLFKEELDASEKLKLMSGLSAINDPRILQRFIGLAWDENNVRSQDYFTCLQNIASNRIGESIVWDYVRQNWENLVSRFGLNERYLGRLIPSITSKFSMKIKLHEMEDFFNRYPNAGAGKAARKQALETVKNNIKWLENNKEQIENWLKNNS